jgi:SNF2 family DNA or RNA helicase
MCREPLTVIKVVDRVSSTSGGGGGGIKKDNTREENLKKVLKQIKTRNPNPKILMFSEFEVSFPHMYASLYELNILGSTLGNKIVDIQNNLTRYKNGDLEALILDPAQSGTGLNLENTTDIIIYHGMDSNMITQIIGRANRLGRVGILHVWKLV